MNIRNPKNISALIGLVGAVNNNGKTENTDAIVREALSSADSDEMLTRIHEEKFTISPNCRTCTHPCGNTSDYDVARFDETPEDIMKLKCEMIDALVECVSRINTASSENACGVDGVQSDTIIDGMSELPQLVYRAISFIGYDLAEETYVKMIDELRESTK